MTEPDPMADEVRSWFGRRTAGEPSADWAEMAGAAAGAGRRRRLAQGGGVVTAGAVMIGTLLLVQQGSPEQATLATVESPTPTPDVLTASPSVASLPSPDASASDTEPQPSRTSRVPRSAEPTPGPTGPGPIRVQVLLSGAPEQGGVTITVYMTSDYGRPSVTRIEFGDGAGMASMPACAGPTAPPPTYSPAPQEQHQTYRHTYRAAGTYRITVRAQVTCSDYPSQGSGSATATVNQGASPTPSPTSPSPSSTSSEPSPTASASGN